MWPEPCCVTDRERKRRHVISKAPGRLADGSAEGMRPVSSDAIGPRCPQRENFDGGQLRFLLEKHFMLAINSDERFSCGPTYFGPPPLCSRTRVVYISAPQAIQLEVRDARVFRLWGSKLQLVAAPGHRDHLPPGMELDIALLFRQVPVAPVPRWDKEKLAGLVLRSQAVLVFLRVFKESWKVLCRVQICLNNPLSWRKTGINRRVLFVVQDSLFCRYHANVWKD